MEITEDYVSFETAKLLKEKGFDVVTEKCYILDNSNLCAVTVGQLFNGKPQGKYEIPAPTLQMACKWLREKHDLHIIAYPFKTDNPTSVKHYCCRVYKTFNLLGCEKYGNETLSSYEEAVEAAIKYCLTDIIK